MSYRKIWEEVHGKIPYDDHGRRMEIHHIDGDRTNNSIDNLMLATIQEHYDIHYSQGDWGACQSIINRMNVSPEEKSKKCSELAKKRFAEGTHHFQDPEWKKNMAIRISKTRSGENHPLYGTEATTETREKMSNSHKKLVEAGTHHLQQEKHKQAMRDKSLKELEQGTHPFQDEKNKEKKRKRHLELLKENKHPFNCEDRIDPNKILIWCDKCQRQIPKPAFNRWHKHETNN